MDIYDKAPNILRLSSQKIHANRTTTDNIKVTTQAVGNEERKYQRLKTYIIFLKPLKKFYKLKLLVVFKIVPCCLTKGICPTHKQRKI